MKVCVLLACASLACASTAVAYDVYLDADTPGTGSDLDTGPLVTAYGTITFVGEIRVTSDPDLAAAGSVGDVFDIISSPDSPAELFFDFDVASMTFIYGGNGGGITIEARDGAGGVLDSFFQASTADGEPAGPITLAGSGIRSLYWNDSEPGWSFAAIDNIGIMVPAPASLSLLALGGLMMRRRR